MFISHKKFIRDLQFYVVLYIGYKQQLSGQALKQYFQLQHIQY
jgi:hypothetical protein